LCEETNEIKTAGQTESDYYIQNDFVEISNSYGDQLSQTTESEIVTSIAYENNSRTDSSHVNH